MSAGRRDTAPDFIRGILIVLMVYGHVTQVGYMREFQETLVDWIYSFHMQIFLMISGYYFFAAMRSPGRLNQIMRRIVVPYLVFEPLYLLALVAANRAGLTTSNPPPQTLAAFGQAVFLDPSGAFWFLHSLAVIQAVLTAIHGRFFHPGKAWILALLVLAALISFGIVETSAIAFFLLGVVLAAAKVELPDSGWVGALGVLVVLFLAAGQPPGFSLVQLAWVLSLASLMSCLSRHVSRRCLLAISWVGRNTMIVLVLHAFFIALLKPAAPLVLAAESSGILWVLLVVVLTISGCLFAARVLDRLDLSQPLFGLRALYVMRNAMLAET